jgi:hypothetical protein
LTVFSLLLTVSLAHYLYRHDPPPASPTASTPGTTLSFARLRAAVAWARAYWADFEKTKWFPTVKVAEHPLLLPGTPCTLFALTHAHFAPFVCTWPTHTLPLLVFTDTTYAHSAVARCLLCTEPTYAHSGFFKISPDSKLKIWFLVKYCKVFRDLGILLQETEFSRSFTIAI